MFALSTHSLFFVRIFVVEEYPSNKYIQQKTVTLHVLQLLLQHLQLPQHQHLLNSKSHVLNRSHALKRVVRTLAEKTMSHQSVVCLAYYYKALHSQSFQPLVVSVVLSVPVQPRPQVTQVVNVKAANSTVNHKLVVLTPRSKSLLGVVKTVKRSSQLKKLAKRMPLLKVLRLFQALLLNQRSQKTQPRL